MKKPLDRPIFILGAARSGTQILGELLGMHRDVKYWIEPKYIWRYRRPLAKSDIRTEKEATPHVSSYIRRRFANHAAKHGAARFLEKTPSNCFRIPFMASIFPEGKYVHIVRDGRDVALSAQKKWQSKPDPTAIWRRLTSFEIPLADLPFYGADMLRDVIGRRVLPKKGFIWGPHFPGIREVRKNHSVLETCAIQWRECMVAIDQHKHHIPAENLFTIHYEAILANPAEKMKEIFDFAGLAHDTAVLDFAAENLMQRNFNKWKTADQESIQRIEQLMDSELQKWGYEVGMKKK